ncbi:MAG: hypothetical protein HOP29_11030 [Phycisphaerales bacterium]|nr:hypothetical protein [Phycisphaerales bacterium]
MDFISEMVLGYADLQLSCRLKKTGISDYRILRYRDDYRVFVNNPQTGETVLKTLTEVMMELGLKLNASKTTGSQSVVTGSLKSDKKTWLTTRQGERDLQKQLLIIHSHGVAFPNSGSLLKPLDHFYRRLVKWKTIRQPVSLISVAVDIAYQSPRTFPTCTAIVSKLLSMLKRTARRDVIQKIHGKMTQLPHTGHMEVWLQRISHTHERGIRYKEALCQLVERKDVPLWNNDWIKCAALKSALDPRAIVDRKKLKQLKPIVPPREIQMFAYEVY